MLNLKLTFLLLVGFLFALVSAGDGLTPIPGTPPPAALYRGDKRGPAAIKTAGGFKGYGTSDKITVFNHVTKQYPPPTRAPQDPFVSTSSSKTKSEEFGTFVYTLNPAAIHSPIFDTIKEFAAISKTHPYPAELEFAVKGIVPFAAITKVETKKDGQWRELKEVNGKWVFAAPTGASSSAASQHPAPTSSKGPTKPTGAPSKTTKGPGKPTGKPTGKPSKPSQGPSKPTGKPGKPPTKGPGHSKIPVKKPGYSFPLDDEPTKQTTPGSKIPVPAKGSPKKAHGKGIKLRRHRARREGY